MCGIAACLSLTNGNVAEQIVTMLKGLEYRGYDSVGVALLDGHEIKLRKDKGKLKDVDRKLKFREMQGSLGIGHTRWATHGKVAKRNAHPHLDCTRSFAVIHNGIIKNHAALRTTLAQEHTLKGETDTELIPHLVESYYDKFGDVFQAFKATLRALEGTFALVMVSTKDPSKIYFARKFSPLLIGMGKDAIFLASDAPAFLEWTKEAIHLKDGDYGYLSNSEVHIENLNMGEVERSVETLPWSSNMAEKGGYPHYMLKEIHEQPQAVRRTLQRTAEGIEDLLDLLSTADRAFIIGAGTSFYASLHAEYSLAKYGLDVEAIIASEFTGRKLHCVDNETLLVGVTQSGETADTLDALRKGKTRGANIAAITNTVGSTITRLSDINLILGAGPEIGVAATKTFTSQVATFCSMTLQLAERRGYDVAATRRTLKETPKTLSHVITDVEPTVQDLSRWMAEHRSCYFIGRGLALPTALEGALKLKELAYVHAEGYPAGESKHGPISLIEQEFPVVALLLKGQHEVRGNITELKSRGATVLTVAEELEELGDYSITLPPGYSNILAPLVYVVPLQMLGYYTAVERGYNPDKPRNLAKCVTVK